MRRAAFGQGLCHCVIAAPGGLFFALGKICPRFVAGSAAAVSSSSPPHGLVNSSSCPLRLPSHRIHERCSEVRPRNTDPAVTKWRPIERARQCREDRATKQARIGSARSARETDNMAPHLSRWSISEAYEEQIWTVVEVLETRRAARPSKPVRERGKCGQRARPVTQKLPGIA